jgi:hypothetical protein
MLTHQLSYEKLVDILFSARERVIWATVNLFEEAAQALIEVRKRNIPITLIIDPSEDAYRNGFGDVNCIRSLEKAGCQIRQAPHNRVSFLIVDQKGYFLFIQSRVLEVEGTGNNAVEIDPILCERLLLEYLPPANVLEATPRLERIMKLAAQATEDLKRLPLEVERAVGNMGVPPLDQEQFEKVKSAIRSNPPLHPDLKRQMNVYTNKFQYVELEFEGANFEQMQVEIPNSVLPFKDVQLKEKLRARLPLFGNLDKFPDVWVDIRNKLDTLRKEYLVKSKKANKNVLAVSNKMEFQAGIMLLRLKLDDARKQLAEFAENEKLDTEARIQNELHEFFKENIPDNLKNHQQRSDFDHQLYKEAIKVVSNIKFPDLSKKLEKVKLHERYSDITWEDLQDEEFRKELFQKGVITDTELKDLSTIETAMGTRR